MKRRVLIVDDDDGVRLGIRDDLAAHGYQVDEATTATAAEETSRTASPDAVVLDFHLRDGDALALLPRLRAVSTDVPVVLLTAQGAIDRAARAIHEGADQILPKPVEMETLRTVLERLLERRRLQQVQRARRSRDGDAPIEPFIGVSAAITRLAGEARQALESDGPILIEGETGSGKGALAAWLHRNGRRAEEVMACLNGTGLPVERLDSELFGHEEGGIDGAVAATPGLLEVAHRGVLLLHEVGQLPPPIQAKLTQVLEWKRFRRLGELRDRSTDIQLLAATHQDLPALVRAKRFRGDLYERVREVSLRVPALRERREDIPLLARALLTRLAVELGHSGVSLAGSAEAALAGYAWPGNVRELRNVLERALLHCDGDTVEARHLTLAGPVAAGAPGADLNSTLAEVEQRHITRVLEAEGGHVERAARRLGIPRSTLYQRLKEARAGAKG